jgi:hypothetical protein
VIWSAPIVCFSSLSLDCSGVHHSHSARFYILPVITGRSTKFKRNSYVWWWLVFAEKHWNAYNGPRYHKPNNVSMGDSGLLLISENKVTHIYISHTPFLNSIILTYLTTHKTGHKIYRAWTRCSKIH